MNAGDAFSYGPDSWKSLKASLKHHRQPFILCDELTKKYCLPVLNEWCPETAGCTVLTIPPGDRSKSMNTCKLLWGKLMERGATRHDLLINLGGGVVSDIGGFVAATYKRGMHYINIPTTLLAMVDAGIGGKTAINFSGVKNAIGSFFFPDKVLINHLFLRTLPDKELRNGFAETIKHALIADRALWNELLAYDFDDIPEDRFIYRSSQIKHAIVAEDPRESGMRKLLNFGHTVGHAIESLSLRNGRDVGHGLAVATGMAVEVMISSGKGMLHIGDEKKIVDLLCQWYPLPAMNHADVEIMLEWMRQDKKNKADEILFTLLRKPGSAVIDVPVTRNEIIAAFDQYRKRCKKQ